MKYDVHLENGIAAAFSFFDYTQKRREYTALHLFSYPPLSKKNTFLVSLTAMCSINKSIYACVMQSANPSYQGTVLLN
jgi:hypothetical protein